MCSIGLLANSIGKDTDDFNKFMSVTIDRGPDYQSIIQPINRILLGANRLNIIDDNPQSNQPLTINQLSISFNGAIYNHADIRNHLKSNGIRFNTESDTELILRSYEFYGKNCVHHFEGMWAFIIVDVRQGLIFGSRDRFGIKPFFYSNYNSRLIIGSDTRQYDMLHFFDKSLNNDQLQYFLESNGNKNYSDKTIYKNINQLEPGHNLTYDINKNILSVNKYYDITETSTNVKNIDLEELLKNSIHKEIPNRDLAVLFSGGLDSSILALEAIKKDVKINSYTYINSKEKEKDESSYVKSFLDQYPHQNQSITLDNQLDKSIFDITKQLDEPILSLSVIAENRLFEQISKENIKVAFSGQGLDEIFAGYPKNLSLVGKSNLLFTTRLVYNNWHYLLKYLNTKSNNELAFRTSIYNPPEISSIKDYMLNLLAKNGLRDRLNYADKNSMQHSVECRVPFLNHKLVEYAFHLDDIIKMKGGKKKGLILDMYASKLPKTIINRKVKLAFNTPESYLYDKGFLDEKKELNQLKNYLPDLKWNDKFSIQNTGNSNLKWLIKFLNVFLSQRL